MFVHVYESPITPAPTFASKNVFSNHFYAVQLLSIIRPDRDVMKTQRLVARASEPFRPKMQYGGVKCSKFTLDWGQNATVVSGRYSVYSVDTDRTSILTAGQNDRGP